MAWCRVTGGPMAPSDKILSTGTTLTVELQGDYADGTNRYPRLHHAELDLTHRRWKPLGKADGNFFFLPAALPGEPVPPRSSFIETQVFADGTSQTVQWATQMEGVAGVVPTWSYVAADLGSAIVPGGSTGLTSPAAITGILLWLDASDPSTLFSDIAMTTPVLERGTVAAWQDKSGAGNHAFQAAAGGRPAYHSSGGAGGGGRVSFVSKYLQTADFGLSQPYTMILLYRLTALPQFAGSDTLADGVSALSAVSVDQTPETYIVASSQLFYPWLTGVSDYDALTALYSDLSSSIRLDGAQVAKGTTGAATTPGGVTVGALASGARGAPVDVSMCLVYDRALSVSEIAAVEAYVLQRAGRVAPTGPQNLIVFDGDSLTVGYQEYMQSYPIQLIAALGRPPWKPYSTAVLGTRVDEMIARAGLTDDPLYSAGNGKNILCFWGGTNNLLQGNDDTTTYNQIVAFCRARRAAGFKVAVCTLTASEYTGGQPANYDTLRLSVNSQIRANWATFADALCDLGLDANIGLTGADTNPTYFHGDKLHLTAAGYTIVAARMASAIGNV